MRPPLAQDCLTRRRLLVSLGVIPVVAFRRARAQNRTEDVPPTLPPMIRAALEGNAKALDTITVSWERTRTSDLPEAELLAFVGYPDWGLDLLSPEKVSLKWDRGAFYVDYRRQIPALIELPDGKVALDTKKRLEEQEQEISFDGRTFYNGDPGDGSGGGCRVIHLDPPEKLVKERPELTIFPRYFHEAGFNFPQAPADLANHQRQESMVTFLVEKCAGSKLDRIRRADVDGSPAEVVEITTPDRVIRFYLDPSRNYAVLRREETTRSGAPIVRAFCFEFIDVSRAGHWLPKRVDIEWHTWKTVPEKQSKLALLRETYIVSDLNYDPNPPDSFVLSKKYNVAGTYVNDATLPGADRAAGGRIVYRYPASSDDLDAVIEAARSKSVR